MHIYGPRLLETYIGEGIILDLLYNQLKHIYTHLLDKRIEVSVLLNCSWCSLMMVLMLLLQGTL